MRKIKLGDKLDICEHSKYVATSRFDKKKKSGVVIQITEELLFIKNDFGYVEAFRLKDPESILTIK